MNDLYAVVGNPVAHSQSPFIHEAFAKQTGQSLRYERVLAPLDAFEATVRRFMDEGGRGCNVTVPFKFEVPALAASCTPRAALAQAANTLRFDSAGWLADNTDGVGLVTDIECHAGRSLRGSTVLLVGAGGAAAGVLGPILAARPARVVVVNRTPQRAHTLAERHAAWAQEQGARLLAGALSDAALLCGGGCDVVINGTASSLSGAEVPVSASLLRTGSLAVDMMYGAPAEPFLQWARQHGAQARDGLGMLVEQAAAAFELWRGVKPQTAPVLQALRERLQAGTS